MEDFEHYTYRQLQTVAKLYKIPANIKRDLLVAGILAVRRNDRDSVDRILEQAKLNRNRNRIRLKRKKGEIQQNGNMSMTSYDHPSSQLQISGDSSSSSNNNSTHYDCKLYSNPRFYIPSFAAELQTIYFSAFTDSDSVSSSFSSNEIYSKYEARKSGPIFSLNHYLRNDSSNIPEAPRHSSYYSSNTFHRQSYMQLPAIDNVNVPYRTMDNGNHCVFSPLQNTGKNESPLGGNNTASYQPDQFRTLSTDRITSSNNNNLAVGTCSSLPYSPNVPVLQGDMNSESNWHSTNVYDSSNTSTDWVLNSIRTDESNKETDYSAPVTQNTSFSNPLTSTTVADVSSVQAEFGESSSDTTETINFPEEITNFLNSSDTSAKTKESMPQTLSSSGAYSTMYSNASSLIQPTTLDYPSINCNNFGSFYGNIDSAATDRTNYELYYQPYWASSYDNSTSAPVNINRSDTTTAATFRPIFTEPAKVPYSLPSFSSSFSNTNHMSDKNSEFMNSQQYWPSYYDTTTSVYPYTNNTSYSTSVQPSNNVASTLMEHSSSPESNCIDLTKIDDTRQTNSRDVCLQTGNNNIWPNKRFRWSTPAQQPASSSPVEDTHNNSATPLSVDDSSSTSSLTIMEDFECDTSNVSENGPRNGKPLDDNYNHDTLMERSKIVCQHLPVKSIQEVRQLVQIYSPKVNCSRSTTQNAVNDEKGKPISVKGLTYFSSRHPCAYKLEGCDYVSKLDYIHSHEKNCLFQPICCPSYSCEWHHSINSLSKHICESHEIDKRSLKMYTIDRLVENREKECHTFYQVYENTIYIVRLRIDEERSMADAIVQYIPQDQSSSINKRHYKGSVKLLSFTSKRTEKKEWKGIIQPYIEMENKNEKVGSSVQINIRNSGYVVALVSIDHKN